MPLADRTIPQQQNGAFSYGSKHLGDIFRCRLCMRFSSLRGKSTSIDNGQIKQGGFIKFISWSAQSALGTLELMSLSPILYAERLVDINKGMAVRGYSRELRTISPLPEGCPTSFWYLSSSAIYTS